jgi:CDGSH-type Zn-finger protein
MENDSKVSIKKDGPYLVSGGFPLKKEIIVSDEQGYSVGWKEGENFPKKESYALCRCGKSKNMPYCDGTHGKINFDGTETASREDYIKQAQKIDGPDFILTDVQELCSLGRFCHNKKGNVWDLTRGSDNLGNKKEAIEQACNCPSGRLVVWDKRTGNQIEPKFEKSISLIEDPARGVSGPIWLKGGIALEGSNGEKYEIRNRASVCRCGKSGNKPFCDGSHVSCRFNDGDKSLQK